MASRKKEASEKAIRLCGKRCVICGWNEESLHGIPLVQGAHIKPVAELENDCFDDIIALDGGGSFMNKRGGKVSATFENRVIPNKVVWG